MYDIKQLFGPPTLYGMKIQVNDQLMSTTVEDWSNVRSRGRAVRRRKRGFKQNIIIKTMPKTEAYILKEQNLMIMHSEFYAKLIKEANKNGQFLTGSYY